MKMFVLMALTASLVNAAARASASADASADAAASAAADATADASADAAADATADASADASAATTTSNYGNYGNYGSYGNYGNYGAEEAQTTTAYGDYGDYGGESNSASVSVNDDEYSYQQSGDNYTINADGEQYGVGRNGDSYSITAEDTTWTLSTDQESYASFDQDGEEIASISEDRGSVSASVMGEEMFSFDETRNGAKMKAKFMDYFFYALATEEGVHASDLQSCMRVCAEERWRNKCCASVTMYEQRSNSTSYIYQCIDQSLSDSDWTMQLDDFEVSIVCENAYSGAAKLFGTAISLTALASTLY